MKEHLEQLFKFNRTLLGEGYDNALEYLKHLIKLDVIEVPSGTKFGTWTVPDEWVVRDGWVKFNGEKILDYKIEPLSLVVGSLPFQGIVSRDELIKHLYWHDEKPEATPYTMKFYEKDWGFCLPKNSVKKDKEIIMPEGDYEVFIDTEWKKGVMKLGVHTIPGKSDKEILLFAHLDHPYQANDNLSAVACLLELSQTLKSDHTIKIVFCPETIGSIAYAYTQDISKVDFMIALELCGNDDPIQVLKTWDKDSKLNKIVHCALQLIGKTYKKGAFRSNIGSDETVFNDPIIGIPGLCISRYPYKEYHTNLDTPEIINYQMITETGDLIKKIIEIADKDFIPVRNFKGPLMRSRYGIQSISQQLNLNYDYLFYSIDGKKSVAELCGEFELPFTNIYETLLKIEADGKLSRADVGQGRQQKTSGKKSPKLSRATNVRGKSKKVPKDI